MWNGDGEERRERLGVSRLRKANIPFAFCWHSQTLLAKKFISHKMEAAETGLSQPPAPMVGQSPRHQSHTSSPPADHQPQRPKRHPSPPLQNCNKFPFVRWSQTRPALHSFRVGSPVHKGE